ncbi:uracil nucleotide/cysteinyl leukotriene receptor-like [Catharus ustulatus]|uniref:uracil nucleotide/cysteinyl leukotriene receptor-like n=1 Tax=Catharus ustulatus TaxID=91951 RepID=UPI001408AC19|nr:uracil nucleotide/cysteinyl leukotriene receptor-like [Catharus ustulatus]
MTKAISGGALRADFHLSNRTNSLISSMTISGGGLEEDFHLSNSANLLICNGTNLPMSNATGAALGVLGADLQHFLLAVTCSLVLLLGLAGNVLSLSLLSCRVKPLSHSYVLLLQLALLDSLLLALLPLHIHSQLLGDTWTFGDKACRASRAVFCLHSSLSVALLSCFCLAQWLALLHPLVSIRLRAAHYALLATALWLLALGATVPLVQPSRELGSCFGSCPESWAQPTTPGTALAVTLGVAVPFVTVLLALPLLAASVWRSGRRAGRRKALATISLVLAICGLCFVPQQLSQLLQLLLGTPQHPLLPKVQRVSEALASCSCCLNPLLYHFHASSKTWHCPCSLRNRPKRVFTICDRNFGDPSWGYRGWMENPRGWNELVQCGDARS